MSLLNRLRSFMHAAFFRRRLERDMEGEWQFHVDRRAEDLVATGLSRVEARRQAQREFGDPLRWKEQGREARGQRIIDEVRQDAAYALRQILHAPGFALVAVLTLALGIGANTAIFSIVHAVLLRPLPYPGSDRLVQVRSTMVAAGLPYSPSSLPDYREWRAQTQTLLEMGAYFNASYNLTGIERPERLQGVRVTASTWPLLGVQPLLGAVFASETEQWGNHRVVVVSHGLWHRRFAGDPQILERTLTLDGESYSIVGVMPASFQFPNAQTELWAPVAFAPDDTSNTRSNHFVNVLGRLQPGASPSEAQADLTLIAEQLGRQFPENSGLGVDVIRWQELIVGDVRRILLLLLGAVGVVALIACANVANLLLARATSRQQELSMRLALGAGRYRIVRQLLTESFVLAGLGALVGWGIAYAVMRALPTLAGSGIPRLTEVSLDGTVLAFTGALTVLTTLGFGLWPAWHTSSNDLHETVRATARAVSGGRATVRGRSALIVAEVSCALVLLVGAGLLILSLVRVQRVDPGFRSDHVLTMQVTLPSLRYDTSERTVRFVDDVVTRLTGLPHVSGAGVTSALPLGGSEWGKYMTIEGRPTPPSLAHVPVVRYRQISPGYLSALGATVRRGRGVSSEDRRGRPEIAIINETAARKLWPDQDPIGQRFTLGPPEALVADQLPADFRGGIDEWRKLFPWITVVGIVGDLRHNGLEREPSAEVFVPFAQGGGEEASTGFYLVARTATDPLRQIDSIQAAIHSVDPNQPLADIRSMDARMTESLARRRFTLVLLAAFGATAVALALVGLYGVMAYSVTQRRKEMGIRAALGAEPRDLFSLVVGQGMRLAVIGVAVGLVLATSLSQLMTSLLFEVSAVHPAMYAAMAVLLLSFAALACWIPSRRAARVDPIATLRES